MSNETKLSIHSSAISNKDKTDLLDLYKEYINLTDDLSSILKSNHPKILAKLTDKILDNLNSGTWNVDVEISKEEQELFTKFVDMSPDDATFGNYAYIDVLSPLSSEHGEHIYSLPAYYQGQAFSNSLPHPVEKIILAYPKGAASDQVLYNVNGKYLLEYKSPTPNKTIDEIIEQDDRGFIRSLSVVVATTELISRCKNKYDVDAIEKCKTEALISENMQTSENVIISVLANLTEKQDRLLKQILYYRDPNNYLGNAQKQDLIPSSVYFQDLLNLRHLIHHQFDTLNGYGRFMNGNNDQNMSIRKRNIESFNRLINGTFAERVSSYKEHAKIFKQFIISICPNALFKEKDESNNKFLQRIKNYATQNPNTTMYIELNVNQPNKKNALIKAIRKISENTIIVDDTQNHDLFSFMQKIKIYEKRQSFLKTFQLIETRISEHCLDCGDNCPAKQGWVKLAKQKLLNQEDIEHWNTFKALRNELSHTNLKNEHIEKIDNIYPLFYKKASELIKKIESVRPTIISQTKDCLLTLKHQDGKIVVIDLKKKQVISITNPRGKDITSQNRQHKSKGRYTEHQEKARLSLKGTQISSLELDNGFTINVDRQRIILPDDCKIFLEEPERIYITTPQAKLITNRNFKVITQIQNKKHISCLKNETIILPNGYKIDIDNNLSVKSIRFTSKGKTQKINFNTKDGKTSILLPDNTKVKLANQKITIYHNDIELNYDNRKSFIESYTQTPPIPPQNER